MKLFQIMAIVMLACASAFAERAAYTVNDEIYVNNLGSPEGSPITSGHPDYKPSWSADGKWIVFFRIMANPGWDISRWKTAIFIVKPDGSELRQLTSGKFTDYNPTWSREGSNFIIINRYEKSLNRCYIYRTTPDSKPGDEILISDPNYSEFGNTCSKDGRILVTSDRFRDKIPGYVLSSSPVKEGYFEPPFVFIMTPDPGHAGRYEQIRFQHKLPALPSRVNLSESERLVAYEVDNSWGNFSYSGHPLVIAEIDLKGLVVSNEVTVHETPGNVCSIYPTFTKDEKGIIYCDNRNNIFQFYYYDRDKKNTTRISSNQGADYKYFCPEAVPK